MAHLRVKFIKGGDYEIEDINEVKGWHLYSKGVGDGEFTGCGLAVVDYDHKTESKEKGGITCKNCLEVIKYYKSIKL